MTLSVFNDFYNVFDIEEAYFGGYYYVVMYNIRCMFRSYSNYIFKTGCKSGLVRTSQERNTGTTFGQFGEQLLANLTFTCLWPLL